jgi:hypothetical protein
MNKWQIICPLITIALVVLTFGLIQEYNERRGFLFAATSSIAWDLVHTTNSEHLAAMEPELRARLSEFLASTGHVAAIALGDESPPIEAGKACSRFVLTNGLGEGLRMLLGHDQDPRLFRIVSYSSMTEPDRAANPSQPGRSKTNLTSSAAGSGR